MTVLSQTFLLDIAVQPQDMDLRGLKRERELCDSRQIYWKTQCNTHIEEIDNQSTHNLTVQNSWTEHYIDRIE